MHLPLTSLSFALLLALPVAAAERWTIQSEVNWHDNVTNGERAEDVLSALQWRTRLETGWSRLFPEGQRVEASAGLSTEAWPRFQGLDRLAPSVGFAWSRKFGLGLHAPVLSVGFDGEWRVAREAGRSGGYGVGDVTLSKRIGETWRGEISHQWERFDARSLTFAQTARVWTGRIERALPASWALAVEGAWREGDVVSYSFPPRTDLVKGGKILTFVDTFEQSVPLIAYYFPGETRSGALELSRSYARSLFAVRHEIRRTFHAGPGYENAVTSLRFITRF